MDTSEITAQVGGKTYKIRKFKPTDGRRIVAGYPITMAPKVGDYDKNEELMLMLMSHVEVQLPNGQSLPLGSIDLINNHISTWEDLVEIEWKVLRFNCPFLESDGAKSFVEWAKEFAGNFIMDAIESVLAKKLSSNEE